MHKKILFFIFISVLVTSCEKSDINIPEDIEVNDFVWKQMNTFYLWQENVIDLSDTRFSLQSQLNTYLARYNSPDELFYNILYQPGIVDKFSWIVDDYIALENSFQGINESNGMEFGLIRYANFSNNIFGYVRYVVPDSDAKAKNVSRGMIFNQINGQQLTDSNYISLLNESSYTISLANFNDGNPVVNGQKIALLKSQISENPIHIAKVFQIDNLKIGYLMYNQFANSYDAVLNNVFDQFKTSGVTDIILDLRYNSGGAVSSATHLAGMLTGQFNNQLFSKQKWNSKITKSFDSNFFYDNFKNEIYYEDGNGNVTIQESINSLQLDRVFVITTESSASASELIINSLKPYIDVFTIGTKTKGKVHGSVTLYDSDDLTRNGDNLNPNHKWAIQPLVFEIVNKDGENFPDGIPPFIEQPESYNNLGDLGEENEPLLARTINYIVFGNKGSFLDKKQSFYLEEIGSSKRLNLVKDNMYIKLK